VKGLGLYLYYRTKKLLDAKPDVPCKIRQMVEFLSEELKMPSTKQKEHLLCDLCDSMGTGGSIYHVLEGLRFGKRSNDVAGFGSNLSTSEKLGAAVLIGNRRLAEQLLSQDPKVTIPYMFGGPMLGSSAALGHMEVLELALERMKAQPSLFPGMSYQMERPIYRAIEGAILNNQVTASQRLLSWYTENLPVMRKAEYNNLMNTAIRFHGSLDIIEGLLEFPFQRHHKRTKINGAHLLGLCTYNRAEIPQVFLSKGYVNAKDAKGKTPPLIVAVRSGHRCYGYSGM